jgi:quinoprotein glucose dehydrogenase
MVRTRILRASRLSLAVLLGVACRGADVQERAFGSASVAPPVGWPAYAGDAGSLRYSPVADISPSNVAALAPAWSWETGEDARDAEETGERVGPGKFEATPLAFGDTLFLSTPFNRVVALDGRTGRELWAFDPKATRWGLISDDRAGFVHRGVASWVGDGARRIMIASRWSLYALDAATGRPVSTFGDQGAVDLAKGLRWPVNRLHIGNTSPPVIWRNVVIVGSAIGDRIIHEQDPPGDVQAFDANTGARLWRWEPIPQQAGAARDSWENGSASRTGHGNVWAPFSVDSAAGLVYLPVSAASNDYYGGNRLGDNLYTQSLVCLDAATGVQRWARQLVHHDLWDYDPASPPALVSITVQGRRIDAVVLAGKTGFLYAFDRRTGEPVWPMTEQSVPASDVPGERAATSQPVPSWPRPFARQGFSLNDVVDYTAEIRAKGAQLLATVRSGPMFAPPSVQGTVQMPGWIGGAGWGSTAIDPVRQLAFVKATNLPVLARVVPTGDARRFVSDTAEVDPAKPLTIPLPDPRWWWPRKASPLALPISKPPYGTLTAVDLTTGEHRWSIVLGDTPAIRRHPALRALDLPALGVAGAPGGVATASGLLFITGGGAELFAIDAESGAVRWSFPLGQMGYSNPMVFRATNGRTYVVVATGNGGGASLRAFALPLSHR